MDTIPSEVLEQAILLRREVPTRSVHQIIQILEWEGVVIPGTVTRSTLQEKLAEKGYSSRQMRLYSDSGKRPDDSSVRAATTCGIPISSTAPIFLRALEARRNRFIW